MQVNIQNGTLKIIVDVAPLKFNLKCIQCSLKGLVGYEYYVTAYLCVKVVIFQ